MIPDMFNATALPVLQEVVGFSHARHEVLAGNLACLLYTSDAADEL